MVLILIKNELNGNVTSQLCKYDVVIPVATIIIEANVANCYKCGRSGLKANVMSLASL